MVIRSSEKSEKKEACYTGYYISFIYFISVTLKSETNNQIFSFEACCHLFIMATKQLADIP